MRRGHHSLESLPLLRELFLVREPPRQHAYIGDTSKIGLTALSLRRQTVVNQATVPEHHRSRWTFDRLLGALFLYEEKVHLGLTTRHHVPVARVADAEAARELTVKLVTALEQR